MKMQWKFKPVKVDVFDALYSRELGLSPMLAWVAMAIYRHMDEIYEEAGRTLGPCSMSVGELANFLGRDRRNIRRSIQELEDLKIVERQGDRIGLVLDIALWAGGVCQTPPVTLQALSGGVPETPEVGSEEHQGGVPETPGVGSVKHQGGVCDTPAGDGRPPNEGAIEVPLDHDPDHVDINHEDHGENLLATSQEECVMSNMSIDDLSKLVRRSFQDSGYAAPPAFPDPVMSFKHYLGVLMQRNNADRRGNSVEEFRYLHDFILPMIQDCPVELRASAPLWTKEFDMALGVCRANSCYMNPWPKKKKSEYGMAPHGDFSDIPEDEERTNF